MSKIKYVVPTRRFAFGDDKSGEAAAAIIAYGFDETVRASVLVNHLGFGFRHNIPGQFNSDTHSGRWLVQVLNAAGLTFVESEDAYEMVPSATGFIDIHTTAGEEVMAISYSPVAEE